MNSLSDYLSDENKIEVSIAIEDTRRVIRNMPAGYIDAEQLNDIDNINIDTLLTILDKRIDNTRNSEALQRLDFHSSALREAFTKLKTLKETYTQQHQNKRQMQRTPASGQKIQNTTKTLFSKGLNQANVIRRSLETSAKRGTELINRIPKQLKQTQNKLAYDLAKDNLIKSIQLLEQHNSELYSKHQVLLENDFHQQASQTIGEQADPITINQQAIAIINEHMQTINNELAEYCVNVSEELNKILKENSVNLDKTKWPKFKSKSQKELSSLKTEQVINHLKELHKAKIDIHNLLKRAYEDARVEVAQIKKETEDKINSDTIELLDSIQSAVIPNIDIESITLEKFRANFIELSTIKQAVQAIANKHKKKLKDIENAENISVDPNEIDLQYKSIDSEYLTPNQALTDALQYIFDNVNNQPQSSTLKKVIYALKNYGHKDFDSIFEVLINSQQRSALMSIFENYNLEEGMIKKLFSLPIKDNKVKEQTEAIANIHAHLKNRNVSPEDIATYIENKWQQLDALSKTLQVIDKGINKEIESLDRDDPIENQKFHQLKTLQADVFNLIFHPDTDVEEIPQVIQSKIEKQLQPTTVNYIMYALESIWQGFKYINPFMTSDKYPRYDRFFTELKGTKETLHAQIDSSTNNKPSDDDPNNDGSNSSSYRKN